MSDAVKFEKGLISQKGAWFLTDDARVIVCIIKND
jgi:hypothetical protein